MRSQDEDVRSEDEAEDGPAIEPTAEEQGACEECGQAEDDLDAFQALEPLSRAQLAVRIRDSPRITLLTVHPSGRVDEATARRNIVDTARGQPAKRSSYDGAPGGAVHLDVRMLRAILAMARTYTFRVTELAGGKHSDRSRHYAGIAFDADVINGQPVNSGNRHARPFMALGRRLGSTEVLGPGDAGHSTHVHCGWPRP